MVFTTKAAALCLVRSTQLLVYPHTLSTISVSENILPIYKPIAMCYRQVNVIKYACKHESPQSDELVNNSMIIRRDTGSAHLIEDTL
jgi:hypothetical protein